MSVKPIVNQTLLTLVKYFQQLLHAKPKPAMDAMVSQRLQDEINHLANLVDHACDAIFSRGLDQRIISWNKGAELLFGYSREEAIGRTPMDLQLTNRSADEIEAVEALIEETGSWHDELYHNHKNGTTFYGEVSGSVMTNNDGITVAYYFIIRDVSRRKMLEEQLRAANSLLEEKVALRTSEILRSEQQYRHLFQNNPLPMWVFETDGFKFLDVNEMAVRKYGYSRAEFLNMTLMDIRPKEDRELFLKTEHHFQGIDDAQVVWTHLKKDGSLIQVEIRAHLINFGGLHARLILANDVTERIKAEKTLAFSEKRFRTLIENSNDIIALTDSGFNLLYRSPSAHRITGWSNEQMLTINGASHIHPDDQAYFRAKVDEIMRHPEKPIDIFFRSRHQAGHYLWLEGTIVNLLGQEHVQAIVFNARDVSERITSEELIKQINTELEERVEHRTAELKKANEELEAFSYSVSHDLRAPLRAIIGFSSILQEDYAQVLGEEGKRITSVIKSNTMRMGNLIDDLLTFSRTGRSEIEKTMVDHEAIVAAVIAGTDTWNSESIAWKVEKLPGTAGEANMMRQVWMNIIQNAAKYSANSQPPMIHIGSYKTGTDIVFFVKDNGVGFDDRYKSKLFKVFQRLHSSEEFEGTGIGLAIVEKIITKHDGKVWAEGAENKGANFFFSLPANTFAHPHS